MTVTEAMSDRVVRVTPDTGLREIARLMRDGELGSVPVAADDRLVGMVTDRDIVIRALAGTDSLDAMTASDVMTPEVLFCYEDEPMDEVLATMAAQQVRRLPVVSREKRLLGIVSIGDLAKRASPSETGSALEGISQDCD